MNQHKVCIFINNLYISITQYIHLDLYLSIQTCIVIVLYKSIDTFMDASLCLHLRPKAAYHILHILGMRSALLRILTAVSG